MSKTSSWITGWLVAARSLLSVVTNQWLTKSGLLVALWRFALAYCALVGGSHSSTQWAPNYHHYWCIGWFGPWHYLLQRTDDIQFKTLVHSFNSGFFIQIWRLLMLYGLLLLWFCFFKVISYSYLQCGFENKKLAWKLQGASTTFAFLCKVLGWLQKYLCKILLPKIGFGILI